jgi:peptidoglycan hydrolase-like amidase
VARPLLALLLLATLARADELSGADKLRVVYSNQFAWTRDGLPIVTVRVLEHRPEVTITGAGARLLPDGEGGAEVRGGARWTVRVVDGKPGRVAWHVVVARAAPGRRADQLPAELAAWRARGQTPRTFEIGALFAVKGQVIDSRVQLVTVGGGSDEAAARELAARLRQRYGVDTSLHPELVERPRGVVEASDERGAVVRNDAILWFTPGASGLLELADIPNARGQHEARQYAGKLYVTLDNDGQLTVVNAVPEDKLLAGLVPAEMSASSPPEALKAQAVAARNELLAKIGSRHLTDPYRLCSTVHCQVYAGAGHEDARATAAVAATRGQLLARADGSLVDTVYSASCGGHGEDNERVWPGSADAALRGRLDADAALVAGALAPFRVVDDAGVRGWLERGPAADGPWCARPKEAATNYRWHKAIDPTAVAPDLGRLKDLVVAERGVSGRAVRLRVVGDGGTREVAGELTIRRLLGNLKSALFALDLTRDGGGHVTAIRAVGGGHGHGVGMCQTGAVGMAHAGKSYLEILRHYYDGAQLRQLY